MSSLGGNQSPVTLPCPTCRSNRVAARIHYARARDTDGREYPYDTPVSQCRECGRRFWTGDQQRAAATAAARAIRVGRVLGPRIWP